MTPAKDAIHEGPDATRKRNFLRTTLDGALASAREDHDYHSGELKAAMEVITACEKAMMELSEL